MRILSLGAGVQSTTLYLLQDWDYAIFADTQEEPAPVYQHLAWLKATGRAPILTVTKGKLGDDLQRGVLTNSRRLGGPTLFASIPAYTMFPGSAREGRTRRQCTKEYKLDLIHQQIRTLLGLQPRQRFPKTVRVTQGIGFSLDELGRAGRCVAGWRRPQILPVFPLIDLRMTRHDCLRWLEGQVPHAVPRSSCVFCPFHSNAEWRWLREADPAGWQRAIQVDAALRMQNVGIGTGFDCALYVHRSCVPLSAATIDEDDTGQLTFEGCTGGCAA